MAESIVKARIDINHQDLTKAGEAMEHVADEQKGIIENWSHYVEKLGEGRKESELVEKVLQRQLTSQRDIATALESQRRTTESIRRMHEESMSRPEGIWGALTQAGRAPTGGYPGLQHRLEQAETSASKTLNRLERMASNPPPHPPPGPHEGGERNETFERAAELGAVWLGIHGVASFGLETIAANRELFPSLRRGAIAAGGRGGAEADRLYGSVTAPPHAAERTIWNATRNALNPFLDVLSGGLLNLPEAAVPTVPAHMTPDQMAKWRLTRLGMGAAEQGEAYAKEAAHLGRRPAMAQIARVAEFGTVMAGSPEVGEQLHDRLYAKYFNSEAQANAIMLGMLRYSASGIPRSELVAQNQNLLDLVASRTASRQMTDDEAATVTGLQGALAHVRGGYGRGAGGVQALQEMVVGDRDDAFNTLRGIRAYQSAFGKSPFSSVESYAQYLDMSGPEGLRNPKMAAARMREFQQDYQRYGAAHMKVWEYPKDSTMTVEKIEALGSAPLLADFERAMGRGDVGRSESSREHKGRLLDQETDRTIRRTQHMRGADIATSEAVKDLGAASSETATNIRNLGNTLIGQNPLMGFLAPVMTTMLGTILARGAGGVIRGIGRGIGGLLGKAGATVAEGVAEGATVGEGAAVGAAATGATAAEGATVAGGVATGLGVGAAGLALGGAAAVTGAAAYVYRQSRRAGTSYQHHRYDDLIRRVMKEEGLPEEYFHLVKGMMARESGFDPSKRGSSGEIGLLQVMPSSYREEGLDPQTAINNPEVQVRAGVRWYRKDLKATGGDPWEAVAAYNGGIGRMRRLGSDINRYPKRIQEHVAAVRGFTDSYAYDDDEIAKQDASLRTRQRDAMHVTGPPPPAGTPHPQPSLSTRDLIAAVQAMRSDNAVEIPPPDQSSTRMMLGLTPDASNMVELLPNPAWPWEHPMMRDSR